jgi:hypothetical protein
MRTAIVVMLLLPVCLLQACSDSDSDNGTAPVQAPGTPPGLAVTNTELTSLTLLWDAADNAEEYILYRSESAAGTYSEVYSGSSTGYVDDDVMYGTTYYYQVSAENSGGESDPSSAVSGTTNVPAGFIVTGSPSGSVDYTFNYVGEYNSMPHYQSDPVGLNIIVAVAGDQAGQWVFEDQIEGMNLFYNAAAAEYPPPSGWYAVIGGSRTYILLTPF